ncbi:BTB/POZ domain-containing protein 19-like [Mytilus edulis]|uniref:BTB/POZ domain-containing protein 19-like n=1 Tax=Mytilus edulis TaxID=6550 RepID=UPI0039EE5BDA
MSNDLKMEGNIAEFAKEMKKIINNKEHSDVKFKIGPNRKAFYAHRCILSARSAIFKALFAEQTPNRDVEIPLPDTSPEIFQAMLEFMYTNCVSLTPKIALDTFGVSIEYGLDELRKLAALYLVENLSVHNACECLQVAVTYSNIELLGATLRFIEEHTEAVLKSKAFQELSDESMNEILQSDNLQMDEIELLKYVKDWATINSTVLEKSVSEVARKVIPKIRFSLLSPEELEKIEKDNKKDNLIPIDCFNNSWRFHATKKGDPSNPLMKRRKGTENRDHLKYLDQ